MFVRPEHPRGLDVGGNKHNDQRTAAHVDEHPSHPEQMDRE